jgi:hypothetical protein
VQPRMRPTCLAHSCPQFEMGEKKENTGTLDLDRWKSDSFPSLGRGFVRVQRGRLVRTVVGLMHCAMALCSSWDCSLAPGASINPRFL